VVVCICGRRFARQRSVLPDPARARDLIIDRHHRCYDLILDRFARRWDRWLLWRSSRRYPHAYLRNVYDVPSFYLLLALRAVVPPDFNSVQVYAAIIVILSFIGWASLRARHSRHVFIPSGTRICPSAKTMGLSDLSIIVRHILPHTLSYSLIAVMLSIRDTFSRNLR